MAKVDMYDDTGESSKDTFTAVLPKEILAGKEFEPGDSVVLKIVSMGGDEIQVAYDSEPEDEMMEEAPEEMAGTPMGGMGDMYT